MEQLGELSLNNDERTIGEYLIGSLENDGLLHKPLSEIEDELTIYHDIHVDEKKITEILQMIQTFDPAGIGARSLQECLPQTCIYLQIVYEIRVQYWHAWGNL